MKRITMIMFGCALSLVSASSIAKESAKKIKAPVIHTCSKKDSSVNALACNIYKEARGESIYGQLAIGYVTINRAKHDSTFPTSVRKVVYQSKQFSWTNHKNGYNIHDRVAWSQSLQVAKVLMKLKDSGYLYDILDTTRGALYYHSKESKPYWSQRFQKTVTIDNHKFYK